MLSSIMKCVSLLGAICMAICSSANAQNGPITSPSYSVDVYQGPVIGNSRVVGLGGAYTAVAEGTASIPFNPAGVAQRTYHSSNWFDWDYDWDLLVPGAGQNEFDFFASGIATTDAFTAFAVGGSLQFGAFGVGLFFRGTDIDFEDRATPPTTYEAGILLSNISFGYAFLKHQLLFGTGFRFGTFDIKRENGSTLFDTVGVGGDFGALYRPENLPLRFGLTYSTPLRAQDPEFCSGADCPAGIVLPNDGVSGPWEVKMGGAYFISLEGKTFNPRPLYLLSDEERAPYASGPPDKTYRGGNYVMISTDIVLIGSSDGALNFIGFATQNEILSPKDVAVSPRFGVEAEILERRLRGRVGTYWEPSRVQGRDGRMHATFSTQVRLFDLDVPLLGWYSPALSAAFDIADNYTNVSASIFTFWH